MNWQVLTDLALGAAALSIARDARKAANYSKEAVEKLADLFKILSGRVDNHDTKIAQLEHSANVVLP